MKDAAGPHCSGSLHRQMQAGRSRKALGDVGQKHRLIEPALLRPAAGGGGGRGGAVENGAGGVGGRVRPGRCAEGGGGGQRTEKPVRPVKASRGSLFCSQPASWPYCRTRFLAASTRFNGTAKAGVIELGIVPGGNQLANCPGEQIGQTHS